MKRLMVGIVVIGGAIIIVDSGFGHMCLATR